jgi:hypothetical protein
MVSFPHFWHFIADAFISCPFNVRAPDLFTLSRSGALVRGSYECSPISLTTITLRLRWGVVYPYKYVK